MLSHVHAMQNYKGYVNSLETFGLVDGPGVRFVVFLQGCFMRCKYCHNPETWKLQEDCQEYDAQTLFNKAYRYRTYWGDHCEKGGITVSGGEPLLQMDFLIEFFTLCKQKGVSTTIDTAGQPFNRDPEWLAKFDKLLSLTDYIMLDLKAFNKDLHKKVTGWENDNILDMAKYVSDKGVKLWIRHVLVPGLTDQEDELVNMREFISTLKTVERVEILPYHTLGLVKWMNLNIYYPLQDTPTPTEEEVERAKKLIGAFVK